MKVSTIFLEVISTLPEAKFIHSQHLMKKLKFSISTANCTFLSRLNSLRICIGIMPFSRQMFGWGAALNFI